MSSAGGVPRASLGRGVSLLCTQKDEKQLSRTQTP